MTDQEILHQVINGIVMVIVGYVAIETIQRWTRWL